VSASGFEFTYDEFGYEIRVVARSRILFFPVPDLGSNYNKKRKGKDKNCVCPRIFAFFDNKKFHIIENYFLIEQVQKNFFDS
jgi:hypothetical protein